MSAAVTDIFAPTDHPDAKPIWPVSDASWEQFRANHPKGTSWADVQGFKAQAGRVLTIPNAEWKLAGLALGLGKGEEPFAFGAIATDAPAGIYKIMDITDPAELTRAALGFALGGYRFGRYRKAPEKGPVQLAAPAGVDIAEILRIKDAADLARDLINTPAEDMGPAELEAAARAVASRFGASCTSIVGDDLLAQGWPLIHAVGRASPRPPRLVDLTWGPADAPKVTIVGKGIVFDTGGLDIKPSSSMALMKKDMGGAAHALALAQLVMSAGLKVRLRLLLPIAENAVAGNAFRTSDVFASRKGLTVEIGNTDAEGRLILADALAEADKDAPDLLIDLATLTGAARVALGPELPPFYTDDDALAADITRHSAAQADPVWRLPLWDSYAKGLDSKIADLKSTADGGFAGSVTAALFLKRFVSAAKSWVHFDIYAWSGDARPGRPQGGAVQAIRALYALIAERAGRG